MLNMPDLVVDNRICQDLPLGDWPRPVVPVEPEGGAGAVEGDGGVAAVHVGHVEVQDEAWAN